MIERPVEIERHYGMEMNVVKLRCWGPQGNLPYYRLLIDQSAREYGKVYTGFWWGSLKERDYVKDPGVDGRIIIRWIFGKWVGGGGID